MDEREYTEMKRQYRSQMEQAQARIAEFEREKSVHEKETSQNPWLVACRPFADETGLTEELAHALLERVEVDSDNHISITLRYRDEYKALAGLLGLETAI